MKSFVETVVGGAVGLIALYVVGRVAYEAGKEMAREECRYEDLKRKNRELESRCVPVEPEEEPKELAVRKEKKKASKILSVIGFMAGKNSMIGRLIRNPEDHQVEAYVDGDELHVNVRRRTC